MIEVRFDILDEVVYLNTASRKFEKVKIQGVQIVPTGISRDETGREVLDGYVVLYKTADGPVLAESEVFASEAEARESWKSVLG